MTTSASSSFLYFGFGSNLSSKRIRKNSPSAEFVSVARLPGYVLRFCGHSHSWKGGTATICEQERGEVWGVVWRISNGHSEALDRWVVIVDVVLLSSVEASLPSPSRQEAAYRRLYVSVFSPNGEELKCRTYQKKKDSESVTAPSPQYLETILTGARENSLPHDYVEKLSSTEHNGYTGEVTIL